jgi:hypothetical protein
MFDGKRVTAKAALGKEFFMQFPRNNHGGVACPGERRQ